MRRRFLSNINKTIPNDYHSEYFAIEALENGLTASLSTKACEYRIDNGRWNTLSASSNTPSINKGQTLSFKGNLTPEYFKGIGTFTISKKCNLKGNIMSLLYGDDFMGQNDLTSKDYAFYELFKDCTRLQNVENLILPSTTLANNCYYGMFQGCTSLKEALELPATTLAYYCYSHMFEGCTSLTTAPQLLPATTLVGNCYEYMFQNCTSLTEAPELPATTLVENCYDSMFQNCTSLTEAPELPATTLAYCCYSYMFNSCTNLNYIKMLATNISVKGCLIGWVYRVASSGTFVKHSQMTSLPIGEDGIPNGWTVKDNNESNLITFTIDGSEYQVEEGMTWKEWVESEYNTDGYENIEQYITKDYIKEPDGNMYIYGNVCYDSLEPVNSTDIIQKNYIYEYDL